MPHWSTLRAQRGCRRRETLDVLSARPDFCHISDASHKSAEDVKALAGDKSTEHVIFIKRKRNAEDNRIILIRVYRTTLRHPVVSTSNAKSVKVREDASESSCPQSTFDREEAHRATSSQRREGCSSTTVGLTRTAREAKV